MHSRILKLTAAAFCFGILTSASVASAAPVGGVAIRDGAAAVGLIDQVQRCRCVERRWNGSCKLRVCRDHWGGSVDSAEPADPVAPSSDAGEEPDDRSMADQEGQNKKELKRRKHGDQ
jgi:hypothetical protein